MNGLSHDELNHKGEFYNFEELPMRLRPKQAPYPPMWYMRNVETSAITGMHSIIVGNLDGFEANVKRYKELWEEHQGPGTLTAQGEEPKIGLVNHLVVAETDEEAIEIAAPAWEHYKWNLGTPRRLEVEKRGLTQFQGERARMRPANQPDREARKDLFSELESAEVQRRRANPGGLEHSAGRGAGAGFGVIAGCPDTIQEYMEEYVSTGAHHFVVPFPWRTLNDRMSVV